jgi:two-component system OmpR family response regulator
VNPKEETVNANAPRILAVDDEENLRFIVSSALRLAGYDVTTANDGREALRQAEALQPSLIVLDVMLPDLDGFEVCRRLRADRFEAPIIFLTARDETEDRLRGLTIGGDDYLTKPFSIEELIARVGVILRRVGRAPTSAVLEYGELSLDDDAHRVTLASREVALSPTEYKLLRLLLRNRGRALSRQQILDHVWDFDFDGESTVVETFISTLRRKLDGNGTGMIETVRGLGYRLGR